MDAGFPDFLDIRIEIGSPLVLLILMKPINQLIICTCVHPVYQFSRHCLLWTLVTLFRETVKHQFYRMFEFGKYNKY